MTNSSPLVSLQSPKDVNFDYIEAELRKNLASLWRWR